MDQFKVYLQLGFEHISDLAAYDHMLFIITLCAYYHYRHWKQILILVTAFTLGHSLTLVLSALDILRVQAEIIEVLIPITIFITAIHNIWRKGDQTSRSIQLNYFLALFFGLIHGLGFSKFF